MSRIGILYICTGKYALFFDDFYRSYQKNFCSNSNLHFFVFSDQEMYLSDKQNVTFVKINNQPWPLITLLRFHTFLSIEEQLMQCEYLFFFNSNMVCERKITEEELLPNSDEKLVFVHHPGYYKTRKIYIPYDRNPKSTAYVPYNKGGVYVIGAVEGGERDAFIHMCHILKDNIDRDLKQNIIAKWHDESQINHYIYTLDKYKLLNPGYCYPVGFDLPFEKKLAGVSKQDKFDIKNFKFVADDLSFMQKVGRKLKVILIPMIGYFKDSLLMKKVK